MFVTTIFEKRYEKAIPQVVLNAFPSGWIPECCILEGMFMLNTSPIGTHNDYGDFLFARFIIPQWLRGSKEVHVIFDNPGTLLSHRKYSKEPGMTTVPLCYQTTCVMK